LTEADIKIAAPNLADIIMHRVSMNRPTRVRMEASPVGGWS
jgi:hypothetical protein